MKIDGLQVQDAKKPIWLNITKRDCTKANRKDPNMCVAALCLLREPNVTDVKVHAGRTYAKVGKKWLRFATSTKLRNEIVAFDRGGSFVPGMYALTPPTVKAEGRRQGSNARGARDRSSKNRTPKRKNPAGRRIPGIRSYMTVEK